MNKALVVADAPKRKVRLGWTREGVGGGGEGVVGGPAGEGDAESDEEVGLAEDDKLLGWRKGGAASRRRLSRNGQGAGGQGRPGRQDLQRLGAAGSHDAEAALGIPAWGLIGKAGGATVGDGREPWPFGCGGGRSEDHLQGTEGFRLLWGLGGRHQPSGSVNRRHEMLDAH
eukprot:CAMPEP_0196666236 /NCGR_PEP_ID=MMETSP1086-20130531/64396_1 /TAXON_ID=77921 /ORGANISM="Cyanoptyche  gloeocystis , Strain SAG4.97" /LENGTH=170 /DNA_ID=CAMNT_0042003399 /DNA_START=531 /DNA_END=1043 /DNA_ORIENTATION=+